MSDRGTTAFSVERAIAFLKRLPGRLEIDATEIRSAPSTAEEFCREFIAARTS